MIAAVEAVPFGHLQLGQRLFRVGDLLPRIGQLLLHITLLLPEFGLAALPFGLAVLVFGKAVLVLQLRRIQLRARQLHLQARKIRREAQRHFAGGNLFFCFQHLFFGGGQLPLALGNLPLCVGQLCAGGGQRGRRSIARGLGRRQPIIGRIALRLHRCHGNARRVVLVLRAVPPVPRFITCVDHRLCGGLVVGKPLLFRRAAGRGHALAHLLLLCVQIGLRGFQLLLFFVYSVPRGGRVVHLLRLGGALAQAGQRGLQPRQLCLSLGDAWLHLRRQLLCGLQLRAAVIQQPFVFGNLRLGLHQGGPARRQLLRLLCQHAGQRFLVSGKLCLTAVDLLLRIV